MSVIVSTLRNNDNKLEKKSLSQYNFTEAYSYHVDCNKIWAVSVYNFNQKAIALYNTSLYQVQEIFSSLINRWNIKKDLKVLNRIDEKNLELKKELKALNRIDEKNLELKKYLKALNRVHVSNLELKEEQNKIVIYGYIYYNKKKQLSSDLIRLINGGFSGELEKFFKRRIELRITRLKYPYLDTGILTDLVSQNIVSRKMRLLLSFRKVLKLIQLAKNDGIANSELINGIDPSKESINDIKMDEEANKQFLLLKKLSNIRYKGLSGIKLVISGRLTQRRTAARSVSKVGQRGTLKNASSYQNLKIANSKSNLANSNAFSKTQNGAFCIKGYIASI